MKRFVLSAAVSLMIFSAWAGEVSVAFGIIPTTNSVDWNSDAETSWLNMSPVYSMDIALRFELPLFFFVGGSTTTYMLTNKENATFYPFFIDYTFKFGWTYKILEIGYEHMCAHSVEALGYYTQEPIFTADRGIDKFYLKLFKKF